MLTSQSYCEDWLWYMESTKNCSYYYSYCITLGICSLNKHFFFLKKVKCKLFKREYTPRVEKAMAPHSSTLAWKITWVEEPGRLQSMGSLRVQHNWVTSLSLFTFVHRRRKWQPTPVFLPGKSQGRGSLVGCRLWGRRESDTTEVT